MEHLLQKSKCSIFHNIFKYMIFQRCQKALLWSKGLSGFSIFLTNYLCFKMTVFGCTTSMTTDHVILTRSIQSQSASKLTLLEFSTFSGYFQVQCKVSKDAKIRNRYNQVPHLTQDTNGKVTNSQLYTTNKSQEVSPFPAGDHKAQINKQTKHKVITNTRQKKHIRSTK